MRFISFTITTAERPAASSCNATLPPLLVHCFMWLATACRKCAYTKLIIGP